MIDIAAVRLVFRRKTALSAGLFGTKLRLQAHNAIVSLSLILVLQACTISPVVDGGIPDVAEELREEITQTVVAEQQRVESFPDLPDVASGGSTNESSEDAPGALTERVRRERATQRDRYVITAHKLNYILPFAYTDSINEMVYAENRVDDAAGFERVEVKFQISLKTQLNEADLFLKDDGLSVAFTLEAWWQLYSDDLSSPFRETNYQPEIFYLKPLLWGPFGGSTAWFAGFEHQSNGQYQGLSRSWNRLYAGLIYERGGLVVQVRPWYRIPEPEKDSPQDADGDDNQDILDFMGHGDILVSFLGAGSEYSALIRANPETGKGAINLRWTFPIFGKFRGLVDYFNGYGDSLIDYEHHQQRLGVGVALTPLF